MNTENGSLARPLDLDAVQAFVLVADLNSFTRAAEALDTTQSAVSLKLKRLEDRLGRRLLERTPRKVRLSAEGAEFLAAARALLDAHTRALNGSAHAPRLSLRLGISDQAAGGDLPVLLAKVGGYDRSLRIEVRIGPSHHLLGAYDRGEIDVAVVCRDSARADGERLFAEPYGWFAVPAWQRSEEPLRIATLTAPCTVRAMVLKTLDDAGVAWTEVFVGGGLPAVAAAAAAGLAVAPLPRRFCPPQIVDVGERLGLPKLPVTELMLYDRSSEPRTREAVRILAAAMRAAAR